MRTIGLIGGMSWESTVEYYKIINNVIKEKLGGFHSAKCVLYSVDFEEIEKYQSNGQWDESARVLTEAAKSLERAGADCVVICTNTMHKISDKIEENISIPLLHIAEVTAAELLSKNIKKVALLGTKYTMEQDFYKSRLINRGIEVIIPNENQRKIVNDTIYNELCLGIISKESKEKILNIITELYNKGAEGVILGCTEIGLLVKQEDTDIELFDTTEIHAKKAALYAIDL